MSEILSNLPRLRQEVEKSGLDAVIAISPEAVPYCAGVFIGTQRSVRERLAIVVWPRQGEPTFIVCNIEEALAREKSWIQDVRTYVEFVKLPTQALAEVLEEKGLAKGRLGIEMGYLSATYYEDLRSRLPKATLMDCVQVFDHTRMIKTEAEIELMAGAFRGTERALLGTYGLIAPGEAERSMASRLTTAILQSGADQIASMYINAGSNTGHVHLLATDYEVRVGDIVKTDAGGYYRGYKSDVSRTAVLGKPSEEQLSIYRRLMKVHHACIEKCRVGSQACDIYATAVEVFKQVDLPFRLPHQGHSIGIGAHEPPMVSPRDETVLEPNMTIVVESRVRWPGKEGYHVEDLVLITPSGPRVLTTTFPSDELFVI